MEFNKLLREFQDPEYAHAYADGFLDSYIATQIKVLRESREWTQAKLAEMAGMKQSRISTMENVNYSAWSLTTLKKLAMAYNLRLKVSFEEFGTLLPEIKTFSRESLVRRPLEEDPVFHDRNSVASISNEWVKSKPKSDALGSIVDLEAYRQKLSTAKQSAGASETGLQREAYKPLMLRLLDEPQKFAGVL